MIRISLKRFPTNSIKCVINFLCVFSCTTYCVVASESIENIFTPMFGVDQKDPFASSSGSGSNLMQTAVIRKEIPKLIRQLDIKTVLDAPCGDFFWMQTVDLCVEKYMGIDVIKKLIQKNQKNYGNERREFIHLDMTVDSLPKADLILCRDCLVHCSFADIAAILQQFKKSGSKYLLTTSFPGRAENRNICTGDWFPIDLTSPPFSLPKPLVVINENCTEQEGLYNDKSLCLWKLNEIEFENGIF